MSKSKPLDKGASWFRPTLDVAATRAIVKQLNPSKYSGRQVNYGLSPAKPWVKRHDASGIRAGTFFTGFGVRPTYHVFVLTELFG
jgi:hypothetical protein